MKTESNLNIIWFDDTEPVPSVRLAKWVLDGSGNIPQAHPFRKAVNQSLFCLLNKGLAKFVFIIIIDLNVICGQGARKLKPSILARSHSARLSQGIARLSLETADHLSPLVCRNLSVNGRVLAVLYPVLEQNLIQSLCLKATRKLIDCYLWFYYDLRTNFGSLVFYHS